jgi:hypothetical protein
MPTKKSDFPSSDCQCSRNLFFFILPDIKASSTHKLKGAKPFPGGSAAKCGGGSWATPRKRMNSPLKKELHSLPGVKPPPIGSAVKRGGVSRGDWGRPLSTPPVASLHSPLGGSGFAPKMYFCK